MDVVLEREQRKDKNCSGSEQGSVTIKPIGRAKENASILRWR
jgi:hypothetical protein